MTSPRNESLIHLWNPPLDGVLKLNFDGSSWGNPGHAGFRCTVQDGSGKVIRVACDPVGICDSRKAECLRLLFGLRELKVLGLSVSMVEGDSKVVVS